MDAHGIEDLHERAGNIVSADGVPRYYGHDYAERANVEHENSPDNVIGGAGNRTTRVLGFAGGDADELGAAEAEHHHNQCHQQAGPGTVGILPHQAVREEAVTHGEPVREACAHAGCGGQDKDDDGQAADNHGDHGHNLDDGEPELELTEFRDAQQVGGADDHQEHGRRHPCRNRREPVVHKRTHH